MYDQYLGSGRLESSQHFLVEAILSLEHANSTQQNLLKTPPTRKVLNNELATIYRSIRQTLDRLSRLYIVLFGPQCSEDGISFSRWISQNRRLVNGFLGPGAETQADKVFDIVLGGDGSLSPAEEAAKGVQQAAKREASPPRPCDTLMQYMSSSVLNLEIRNVRRLLEKRFLTTRGGVPRALVKNLDAFEKCYFLPRDPTTDCVWNVDHQSSRIEVFSKSDVGKTYRAKCICATAKAKKKKKTIAHDKDPYCPKNPKDEDKSSTPKTEETKVEVAKVEEKADPTESFRCKALMAEILDTISPQHVKDHFRKIREIVSSNYKTESPWEGQCFGTVLMGPATTGKSKIAQRYCEYLSKCGVVPKELRVEREASYMIDNNKIEEYFTRLADGGILSIENAHLFISHKHRDRLAMDYILEQVKKSNGKIVLILHGDEPELRDFLARTKSPELLPHVLALNEFKGEEALTVLRNGMEDFFGEKTQIEGGWDGLYMRIAARRIKNQNKDSTDITEAVGTLVKDIYKRQRKRIGEARIKKGKSDTPKESTKDSRESAKSGGKDSEQGKTDKTFETGKEESAASTDPEKQQVSGKESSQSVGTSTETEDAPKVQSRTSTFSPPKQETLAAPVEAKEVKEVEEKVSEKVSSVVTVHLSADSKASKDTTTVEVVEIQSGSSSGQSTPTIELEEQEKADPANIPEEVTSTKPTPEEPMSKAVGEIQEKQTDTPNDQTAPVAHPKLEEKTTPPDQIPADIQELKPQASSIQSTTTTKQSTGEANVELESKVNTSENTDGQKSVAGDDLGSKLAGLQGEVTKTPETQDAKAQETPVKSKDLKVEAKEESATQEKSADNSDDDDADSDDSASTTLTTPDVDEAKPDEAVTGSSEDLKEDSEEYTFTKDDILGPAPTNKVLESEAWKKLDKLVGLQKVKESLLNFLELAKANYDRELKEKPLLEFTFNRLFLGPPGTGKTVVAKLYGQILAEIGVLSKGELVVKNASDLLGKYIGDSETNTKAALTEAKGNVLVLDEAYMLYTSDGVSNTTDQYRQGIIDTLVGGIQNVPGEDLCVLLLGYEEQMTAFLTESNPGLIRRFPIEDAFVFEEFTVPELEQILRAKLEEYGLEATEEAIKVAMGLLDRSRSRMNFGNGGAVENLVTTAKSNCLKRIIGIPEDKRPSDAWVFEPQDFDPEFDRGKTATQNLKNLFSDVIGCDEIVKKFEDYQLVCQAMKSRNMDPRGYIPTNFIFKGPPGTGKTTTARKIAQVYYDMGFLSEATVVECSVSDLIGRYVGQTGPRTVKTLERGLGKVLFIDEAYRLGEGGSKSYASEAVSELVDCLTKPKFLGKIIVILAGYEDEMNALLAMNPGLASRFPEEIMFELLPAKGCLEVLQTKLKESDVALPCMDADKDSFDRDSLERSLRNLAQTPSWGNARDVETLAKSIVRKVLLKVTDPTSALVCTPEIAKEVMEEMLTERRARDGLVNVAGMYC